MSKSKKLIFGFSLAFLIFAILSGLALLFLSAYARDAIDEERDEALFAAAKGGKTRYFTGGDEPEEIETSLSEGGRLWTPLSEMPDVLIDAFLSAEDRSFYSHHGVDVKRTALALLNQVTKRRPTFGASTITQQVVKNISGDNDVTFRRKLNEILRAFRIENRHGKDEILEVYLNIVPLSGNLSGVGAGAKDYFGKTPSELSLSEAATLAAVTNAPALYHPRLHADSCREKRDRVLYAMLDNGKITEEEYLAAKDEPLSVLPEEEDGGAIRSWFLETVDADIVSDLVSKKGMSEAGARLLLLNGGLSVYTTEDLFVQKTLEGVFENTEKLPRATKDGLRFAMVVCDSKTGDLLGIVGRDGEKQGNRLLNYATVPHTPGSALKPIALYAPLIDERRISPATVFDDVPVSFSGAEKNFKPFPRNYPDVYAGLTTVKDALRLSKNTVAVRLYRLRGAERIYTDLTEKFGFDTLVKREEKDGRVYTDLDVSPLALGQLTFGVSLRKLTESYTVFPAEGLLRKGRSYSAVFLPDGTPLLENAPEEKRVYRAEAARVMNTLLSGVVSSGTAKSIRLKDMVDTAGKTGTSGSDRDRLFIGYTPYFTAGIWCGFEDGTRAIGQISPSHLSIWDSVMRKLHEEKLAGVSENEIESFSTEGLVRRVYCKDSGSVPAPVCTLDPRGDRADVAYFEPENAPQEICSRHIPVRYDVLTEAVAGEDCPEEEITLVALLDIPDRRFPYDLTVTDAEFVFRRVEKEIHPQGFDRAYFAETLPDGVFPGRSKKKKQFNSGCYLHDGA